MSKFVQLEKPPASPRERLAAVEDALSELPHQYHVEYVEGPGDPAVYVNYDFEVAVVISNSPEGYHVEALAWDRTHGISDEYYIGVLADAQVAAQVAVQFAKDHESRD